MSDLDRRELIQGAAITAAATVLGSGAEAQSSPEALAKEIKRIKTRLSGPRGAEGIAMLQERNLDPLLELADEFVKTHHGNMETLWDFLKTTITSWPEDLRKTILEPAKRAILIKRTKGLAKIEIPQSMIDGVHDVRALQHIEPWIKGAPGAIHAIRIGKELPFVDTRIARSATPEKIAEIQGRALSNLRAIVSYLDDALGKKTPKAAEATQAAVSMVKTLETQQTQRRR